MKTCCLVAASEFNANAFHHLYDEGRLGFIVAVDAGYRHLREAACTPDYILGDFDSLAFVPEGDNVEVHPTHKDKSDLELAFDYVLEADFEEAFVFGALGGRLDHTIGNLQVGARFAEKGLAVTFVDRDAFVRVLAGPAQFELPQLERGTVSVFSASDMAYGVTERGLEYPLSDACLTNRTTLGLSNELVGKPASISVERGTLLVFYPIP